MYLFWIISSIFIFQIILILDFLLKLIYISYYQNKYKSLLNLFLNNLYNKKNNLKIRRISNKPKIIQYSLFFKLKFIINI